MNARSRRQLVTKMRTITTLVLLVLMESTSAASSECPRQCRCDSARKTVYCMNKGLFKLPLGIPVDTRTIFLQNNQLVNSPDLDSILSSLTSLTKLDLSNNSLTSFPRNLPRSLSWISIKDNDIKYIGSQSLEGLDKLQSLYLDNNSITNKGLSSSAFSGAKNLHTISLKWNRLKSLPEGLPPGLRFAQFSHNLINVVPIDALGHLINVVSLDLNYNFLGSDSFTQNSLRPLFELRYLHLSHNRLTYIPAGLPRNLTQLSASHNLLKAVNEPVLGRGRSMSFSGLAFLEHLDLSFNRLQSIEPESFSSLVSLKTVILHDNPWRCDCHLKYLKSWLSETPVLMTMDSNTICFTPDAFQGVTLRSLDHVSLTCSGKQVPEYNISTAPTSITLSWPKSAASYPEYVEYTAFCGVPKCQDCSQREIIDSAESQDYEYVSSIVKSYDLFPTDSRNVERAMARVVISNRIPGKLYIVCLLRAHKDISELKIEDCDFIETERQINTPSPIQDGELTVPVWITVLIAFLVVLVLAAIALVIYCQRLNAKNSKWKGQKPAQMTYDPFRRIYNMPGHRADSRSNRSYDHTTPGGMSASNFRESYIRGSATQDAGKEFDVTLMINSTSNRNLPLVASPETCESCCSDCHAGSSISTSRTRTNTTDDSMGSQADGVNYHGRHHHRSPPRYETHTVANCNGYTTS